MPTGEVDTYAVASAVLQSGTQLPFPVSLAITTARPTLPLSTPFPFFSGVFLFCFLASLIPLTRKEFVRAEGGSYAPGRDGRIQNLRR
jgi:hypothetical protein